MHAEIDHILNHVQSVSMDNFVNMNHNSLTTVTMENGEGSVMITVSGTLINLWLFAHDWATATLVRLLVHGCTANTTLACPWGYK